MDTTTSIGMRWHKFLINFALWACAIANLLMGLISLCLLLDPPGTHRKAALLGAIVCGLFMIFCAVHCVLVRGQLARFEAGAPKNLLALQMISIITGAAFAAIVPDISITSIVPALLIAILTYIYYQRRNFLFVN